MTRRSKRYQEHAVLFAGDHSPTEACSLLSGRGSGQVVLASSAQPSEIFVVDLPHGRGRLVRVGLLTPGPIPTGIIDASRMPPEDLGTLDVLVAHPAAMVPLQGRSDLGRRGLMPSVRNFTLGVDASLLAERYRDGRVWTRADKMGSLSIPVGSLTMSASQLEENVTATGRSGVLVGHGLPPIRFS